MQLEPQDNYVEYDPDRVDYLMEQTRNSFAAGGAVTAKTDAYQYDPAKIQHMMDSLHEEMNNGY